MQTIAEHLAAYAAALKFEDLPAEVVHRTKRIIMDTLGCAFGGYDSEPASIVREQAALISSSQPATILCSGRTTSIDLAVFANGVMILSLPFTHAYITNGAS